MHLIYNRSESLDVTCYFRHASCVIYANLSATSTSANRIHGALLLLAAILNRHSCGLIDNSVPPGMYWQPPLICQNILNLWLEVALGARGINAKNVEIRLAAMALIPSLLSFTKPRRPLLHETVNALLKALNAGEASLAAVCRCSFVAERSLHVPVDAALSADMIEAVFARLLEKLCGSLQGDLSVIRCLTLLLRSLGEHRRFLRRGNLDISRSLDVVYLKVKQSIPHLLMRGLSRTILELITVLNNYFPSLRSLTQFYVHNRVVILLRDCGWTRYIGVDPAGVTTSCSSNNVRFPFFTKRDEIAPKPSAGYSHQPPVYGSCVPVFVMSKLQFAFGILSRLNFFEDQNTRNAFSLLVAIGFVAVEHVGNPESAVCLESSVVSWKCLEQLYYLAKFSIPVMSFNVPLAFMQSLVERVFLAIMSGKPRLRHIALSFLPDSCDQLILMAPRLVRSLCKLSSDDSSSVQQIALQIISRLVKKLPTMIMPKLVSHLGRLLPSLTDVDILPSLTDKKKIMGSNMGNTNRLCWRQSEPFFAPGFCESDKASLDALLLLAAAMESGLCPLVSCVPTIFPLVARVLASAHVTSVAAAVASSLTGRLTVLCGKSVLPVALKTIPKVAEVLCSQPVDKPHLTWMTARALESLVSITGAILTSHYTHVEALIHTLLCMLGSPFMNQDMQALRTLGALGALDPSFLSFVKLIKSESYIDQVDASHFLRAVDLPGAPLYFRYRLKHLICVKLPVLPQKILPFDLDCNGLQVQELFQIAALRFLLQTIANLPQFRKQALHAVHQVCSWLHPSAFPLRAALSQLLWILALQGQCHAQIPASALASALPTAQFIKRYVPMSCCQTKGSYLPVEATKTSKNEFDNHSVQVIANNLLHILAHVTQSAIMTECFNGQLPAALSYLWVLATSFEVSDELGEKFLQIVYCLNQRLSPHDFASHLEWILPLIVNSLLLDILYPSLHLLDFTKAPLKNSGHFEIVVGITLDRLNTIASSSCIRAPESLAESKLSLLLISVLRLVHGVSHRSILDNISTRFIKSMTACLCRSLRQFDTQQDGPRDHNIEKPNSVTNQHAAVVSSLAAYGISIIARRLGVSFLPFMHHTNNILKKWIRGAKTNVDYVVPEILCYTEYYNVQVAIARGMPPPPPTQACTHILRADFDELYEILTSTQPYHVWQQFFGAAALHCKRASRDPIRLFSYNASHERSDFIVDVMALRRAWETDGFISNDEWAEWIHRVSVESLRQSPSPYLRPCATIAEVYQPVAFQMLRLAFFAVWVVCSSAGSPHSAKRKLSRSLSVAICSDALPTSFLLLLLDVIDFTRLYCAPIPVDLTVFARRAVEAHAFGKAMLMREVQLRLQSQSDLHIDRVIESLVATSNHLGMTEAATGILAAARSSARPTPQLYEELKQWNAALATYEAGSKLHCRLMPGAPTLGRLARAVELRSCNTGMKSPRVNWLDSRIGRLRCHSALFEHCTVSDGARGLWIAIKSCFDTFADGVILAREEQTAQAPGRIVANVVTRKYQERLKRVAVLGAHSSWMMQKWRKMEAYVTYWDAHQARSAREGDSSQLTLGSAWHINRDDQSGFCKAHELLLFQSVLIINPENFIRLSAKVLNRISSAISQALSLIQAARAQLLEDARMHMCRGSYDHDYYYIMTAQQLTEFEEILRLESQTYSCHSGSMNKFGIHVADSFLNVLSKWKRRVRWWGGISSGKWHDVLNLRRLIVCPEEDTEAYLRLADSCQNSGQLSRCGNVLSFLDAELLCTKPSQIPNRSLSLRVSRLLWIAGNRIEAYEMISKLIEHMLSTQQIRQSVKSKCPGYEILITSVLLRSEWCGILTRVSDKYMQCACLDEVIPTLQKIICLVPRQPRGWHAWALANYEMCDQIERRMLPTVNSKATHLTSLLKQSNLKHAAQAIEGFFKSLILFDAYSANVRDIVILQDTLRLLTIWFRHGSLREVNTQVKDGLVMTRLDVWLGVLPQLIARVNHSVRRVRYLVADLLVQLGRAHPKSLIYPITVSAKALTDSRRAASARILVGLQHFASCEHFGQIKVHERAHNRTAEIDVLVSEANLVSRELHHLATTWHEAWYQGIEAAANLFFGDRDVTMTAASLLELHTRWHADVRALKNGSTHEGFPSSAESKLATLRLAAFFHAHASDLQMAEAYVDQHRKFSTPVELHQAWDMYSSIHRKVKVSVLTSDFSGIDLGHAAPALLLASNMRLSVPGTDMVRQDEDFVEISSFSRHVKILPSKQRPRCLRMFGSDGDEYDFLLKGHEDLRQDERVMQLFGLINALLDKTASHNGNSKRLHIQKYVVMPLSNNSGLIGWVHYCSTIYALIVRHRAYFSVPLEVEARYANSLTHKYGKLLFLQKVDVFKHVLYRSQHDDLSRMLSLTSRDLVAWLERRSQFARSVAVNSVVGYILGLGDRHLSNIMVSDKSGEVVHIDFGDCFEVAMRREYFPETIPFRLTKLLVSAMEVSGVEGSYRLTCNYVMKMLRSEYHSLMAMLEAFVHDPLVDWKLPDITDTRQQSNLQKRIMLITDCIQKKLAGCIRNTCLSPIQQTDALICQAQSEENLCQMFGGWCPYW
mmetsp:Transcript_14091/g.42105  ORF Transcript_14091/g.42105 Transcript_14091/m.42105 type:complete len:2582 (-) Transcript_14091:13-7758(-)